MVDDLEMALVELERLRLDLKLSKSRVKRIETKLGFMTYDLEQILERLRAENAKWTQ